MPLDTGASDAGEACAPPIDPAKSAICLTLSPEAIAFMSDPALDGKGYLVAQAFGVAVPDLGDGGSVAALATVVLPGGDAGVDAGPVDLSHSLPVVRFDGLPQTAFVRAIFVDDPGPAAGLHAGDWLAGYDMSAGIYKGVPLAPQALTAGEGTAVTLNLVALRKMTITLGRTAALEGNGQGPATVLAASQQNLGAGAHLFGLGTAPCANVSGTLTADVAGFVFGQGPYFVTGVLDDFGASDGGAFFAAGSLSSLEVTADGGAQIPAANALSYAPTAYAVTKTIALGFVGPGDAGTDGVTCP